MLLSLLHARVRRRQVLAEKVHAMVLLSLLPKQKPRLITNVAGLVARTMPLPRGQNSVLDASERMRDLRIRNGKCVVPTAAPKESCVTVETATPKESWVIAATAAPGESWVIAATPFLEEEETRW